MLRKDRTDLTLWLGVGAALSVAGLTGCGGHSSRNKNNGTTVAGATSSTTGSPTSGTVGGPGGGVVVGGGPGGVIGGGPGGTGGLPGGGLPGGGIPGGGLPGGGGASNPNDDHGNNAASATAVPAMNTAVAGRIEVGGDEDWFKVTLGLGNNYSFLVNDLQQGMDSVVRLVDRDGTTVIGENDDASPTDTSSRFDAPAILQAGDYYVVVKHKTGTGTGTYAFRYTLTAALPPPPRPDDHGDDYQTATQIQVGTATAGEISNPADVDWFKVDLVAGTSYEMLTQNLSFNMDTVLELYRTDGTTLEEDNDDTNDFNNPDYYSSRLPNLITTGFTPPTSGTYYLAVYHYSPSVAQETYEIVVRQFGGGTTTPNDDHGNDAQTATQITVGTAQAGAIQGAGDVDFFKVDLVAGAEYEFKTQTLGAGMDTKLYVYESDGVTQIPDGYNDDARGGAFTLSSRVPDTAGTFFTPSAAGTYYLKVQHFSAAAAQGTYEVVALLNGAAPPPPPPPPPPTNAALATATLTDVDGSGDASAGDTIVLGFSSAVTTGATPGTIDPANELDLLVAGDSFGTGATLVAGPAATEVTITLGQSPSLRLTGTFDPAALQANSPSGIALKTMTVISDAATGLAATGFVDVGSNLTAGFRASASLVTPRGLAPAVVLDDGRILVTNGLSTNAQNQPVFVGTSEVYDPVTNTWLETTDPTLGGPTWGFQVGVVPGSNPPQGYVIYRYDHTATKLASGKVLVAGGYGSERLDTAGNRIVEDLSSCFVFDPNTNEFEPAGNGLLNIPRSAHYATLLPNGQVLIAGGFNETLNNGQGASLPVAELFDEAAGTFTMLSATGNDMDYPRQEGTADVVGNKVLFVGGMTWFLPAGATQIGFGLPPTSESFDPATGTFATDAALSGRRWHDTAKLPSGELLVVGGDIAQANVVGSIGEVVKYDPATSQFSSVGNLTNGRARARAVMVNGNLLVVGGIKIDRTAGAATPLSDVANAELYDVRFNVSESYQLISPRNSHSVVTLQNGRKAMVIGGYMGSTSLYGTTSTPVAGCEVFQIP